MRLITQAELLANATDVDGASADGHQPGDRHGQRHAGRQRRRHLELHPGGQRRHGGDFSYTVTTAALTAAGSATLDITPVNDAPMTTPVTLAAIAEDSGARLITQAELLANATDVDGASLTASSLAIAAGSGTLVDNGNGTWSYTPALNDDTPVTFSYTVSDGSLTRRRQRHARHHAGQRRADDHAGDAGGDRRGQRRAADHPGRAAGQRHRRGRRQPDRQHLAIATGSGTLVDNGNGTWSYTPALNDDTR